MGSLDNNAPSHTRYRNIDPTLFKCLMEEWASRSKQGYGPYDTRMWVIPPEGLIESWAIESCPELKELQEIVGGMIQIVNVVVGGVATELICNEEGMLFDLPENPRALSYVDYTDALMPRLYGTVVIFSKPTVI